MQQNTKTGREARGTTSPPYPNTPNDLTSPPCDPRATGRAHPGLPGAVRCHGCLRLPLSLHVRPWAHLHERANGALVWQVRLPGPEGRPLWTALPRMQPVRWAQISRLPEVAAAALALLARAQEARERPPLRSGPRRTRGRPPSEREVA